MVGAWLLECGEKLCLARRMSGHEERLKEARESVRPGGGAGRRERDKGRIGREDKEEEEERADMWVLYKS